MKKIILAITVLTLVTTALFFACTKESTRKSEPLNFDKYITEYNIGKLNHEKGQVLKGRVHLNVTSDKFLVLWVEDNAQPDYVFFLQPYASIKVNKIIEKGQVLIMPDYFLINDFNKNENTILKVPNAVLPDIYNKINLATQYEGYGLVRSLDEKNYQLLKNQYSTLSTRDEEFENDIKPKAKCCHPTIDAGTTGCHGCDAGGIGSTSCSAGGLSVTCYSGFYACCKL